ncbi:MAG: hypothetical protein F6K65_32315, partial [Moorea sp. SIO3C2]|nr:hypothetical protein [Moorena sp. SIO3C2]
VRGHVHDIGERLDGLGGVPAASFSKLAELCCFEPEADGIYRCRQMIENNLAAEQAIIAVLRRLTAQAESLGDLGTTWRGSCTPPITSTVSSTARRKPPIHSAFQYEAR